MNNTSVPFFNIMLIAFHLNAHLILYTYSFVVTAYERGKVWNNPAEHSKTRLIILNVGKQL